MAVNIQTNARGWWEVSSAAHWTARVLWPTATDVYAVTQDSGATPKLRVAKGNAYPTPTSFSEQDSANNKTITNVAYPYDSWLHTDGMLHVIGFTATNTLTHFRFDTTTNLWTTGFGNISTAVENEHTVRVVVRSNGNVAVFFTSSADDADLGYFLYNGTNWTSVGSVTGLLSVNTTAASSVIGAGVDSTDRIWVVYYDAAQSDIGYRTLNSANTFAGAVDIETSGPAPLSQQSGARYNLYDDAGTEKIIAGYISSAAIYTTVITLEADAAAGNLGQVGVVESLGADIGARTPISTAVLSNGTQYVSTWDDASGGSIFYRTWAGAAWSGRTTFATGITKLIEIVPYSEGLAVVYQNGTTVTVDWIVACTVSGTGTATAATASAGGGTHTGTGQRHESATAVVGTAAAGGGTHSLIVPVHGTGTLTRGLVTAGSFIQQTNTPATFLFGTVFNPMMGQSITPYVAHTLRKATVHVGRNVAAGNTGNVWMELHGTVSSTPSGTPLATSDSVAKSSLANPSPVWQEFTFSTPYSMSSATRYWFVVNTDTPDDSHPIVWSNLGKAFWVGEGYSSFFGSSWSAATTTDLAIVLPSIAVGGAGAVGTTTAGTAGAAGGAHVAGSGTTGVATAGAAGSAGGTHTAAAVGASVRVRVSWLLMTIPEASGVASSTGNATRGQATAAGGTHTGAGQRFETGSATVGTTTALGGAHVGASGVAGTVVAGSAVASGGTYVGGSGASGTATRGQATATGGTHTGTATVSVSATGNATAGTAAAAGGTHTGAGAVSASGSTTVGTTAAAGGTHAGGSGALGTTTVGTATATGGTHSGSATVVIHGSGNATVGTAGAAGNAHTGVAGSTAQAGTGAATCAGGNHAGSAGGRGTTTVGMAAASGGAHTSIAGQGTSGTTTLGTATATGLAHGGSSGARGTTTNGTSAAAGGTHTGNVGTANTGFQVVGTATSVGGNHAAGAGMRGTASVGTVATQGGAHSAAVGYTGTTTRGQAATQGGAHIGRGNTTGTTVRGQATAVGGSHTGATANAQDESGITTRGTAAAGGGSHTAGANAAATATVGLTTATGTTHTGVGGATAIVIVSGAVATGGVHTGTVADATITNVGVASAAGGAHTGRAGAVATLDPPTSTAASSGGLHRLVVGALLDEYIPSGSNPYTDNPAGRPPNGAHPGGSTIIVIVGAGNTEDPGIPAGHGADLIPAGKP